MDDHHVRSNMRQLRPVLSRLEDGVRDMLESAPNYQYPDDEARAFVLSELADHIRHTDGEVVAVAALLELAADIIQDVMWQVQWAQAGIAKGEPDNWEHDLECFRQLVSKFSNTARHLVQPCFGPARWPASREQATRQ